MWAGPKVVMWVVIPKEGFQGAEEEHGSPAWFAAGE